MAAKATSSAKKTTKATRSAAEPRRATTRRRAPTHDKIAERAYLISLEGGGDELSNWLRAEQELRG